MKNKIFRFIDNIYYKLYKKVYKITYVYLTNKKTKKLKKLTYGEKKKITNFWKKEFGKKIPLNEYKWYKNKFNIFDERIIPDSIWHSEIEPYFCNIKLEKGFCDKNYFDTLIESNNSPKSIIRCINYQLLSFDYKPINIQECLDELVKFEEVILKPTILSGSGRGIIFIKKDEFDENKIKKLIAIYEGNFIIQKIIKQNKFLAQFNNNSTNTFRILSFLYKGQVYILSSFLKFGGEKSRLDNVSSGGSFIPISKDGELFSYVYTEDKTNNDLIKIDSISCIDLSKKIIVPYWNIVIDCIKKYHYKLPHFRLINWDVSISEDGKPIIIEYNLLDSSVSFHQISVGPIFKDMTKEILNEIRDKRK